MIVDHLQNAAFYCNLHPRLAQGLEYLQQMDFHSLAPGRNAIDGDSLYVMRQDYDTRLVESGKWEAHRIYADIQFIVEGEERIGYAPLESMQVETSYQADGDYALYHGTGDFFRLVQGQFAIFLPQDAHMPCIAVDAPSAVKKAVIKVRLSL